MKKITVTLVPKTLPADSEGMLIVSAFDVDGNVIFHGLDLATAKRIMDKNVSEGSSAIGSLSLEVFSARVSDKTSIRTLDVSGGKNALTVSTLFLDGSDGHITEAVDAMIKGLGRHIASKI